MESSLTIRKINTVVWLLAVYNFKCEVLRYFSLIHVFILIILSAEFNDIQIFLFLGLISSFWPP
jgi:hypothetical protein